MAEQNDSNAHHTEAADATSQVDARPVTRAALAADTGRNHRRAGARSSRRRRPVRSLAVFGAIGALVVAAALPAYGAWRPAEGARTIQQVASADAQTMVVASNATEAPIQRGSYAATTADEIAKTKAEAAAAERAKAAAAARASTASAGAGASAPSIDLSMTAPGSGAIRWPLAHVDHVGDGFHARGGEHQGVDLLDPARTPIFAAAAGVVRVSQESYYGYGVAVVIDSAINGQKVTTVYAHMTYGSRVVQAGQTVAAGQLIGLVGMTGRATANHLHFEVHLNGVAVDPLAWLVTNAGPVP